MYGAYHGPECGDCESAGGLGLYIPLEPDNGEPAFATDPDNWWRDPVSRILTAGAERISGATSPYSPGTANYGDAGYATPEYSPPANPYAGAGRPAGMSTATMLLWAAVGFGGLRLAGVI